MAFLSDRILDQGLASLSTEATRLDICASLPASYSAATTTTSLGHRTGLSPGAPGPRTPSGRRVTIPAITDGTVTASGTANHWALSDPGASRLLAAGALLASQSVTSGNSFSLEAFDIALPGVSP